MSDNKTPDVEGPKDIVIAANRTSKTAHLIQRSGVWLRRITWALIIILPLFYMVAALGSRWGWWDWQTGLGTLSRGVGTKLIMATLAVGIICLIVTLLSKKKGKGLLTSAIAILMAAGAMVYGSKVKTTAQNLPFIHDITTDTQNVPTFSQHMLDIRERTKGVNSVEYIGKKDQRDGKLYSVLQSKAYPNVRPLILSENPEQVFGQALATAKQMGWTVHTEDLDRGIIEATATTFWYGFKDDIVIRIHAGEGGGTVVDIRSVSRVGQSDLGANAKRIMTFINALK